MVKSERQWEKTKLGNIYALSSLDARPASLFIERELLMHSLRPWGRYAEEKYLIEILMTPNTWTSFPQRQALENIQVAQH